VAPEPDPEPEPALEAATEGPAHDNVAEPEVDALPRPRRRRGASRPAGPPV
jgi:hypothetical protein